jgi:hypothetical protein
MQDHLRDALAGIERPGSFVVRRELPASNLVLKVLGVGAVPFPVSATKARELCSVALLARHGRKHQTLLDRRVRDTWEIPATRIKIEQRRWNKALRVELDAIRQGLGLGPDCTLRAELHNLLVYEPGQFFVPHQDSEKEDDMIGTLVVTLPSKFSGGAMVVRHHDERLEFRGSGSKVGLVAFYADCHHEVRPVKDGYRVVLTYNLMLEKAGDSEPQLAPVTVLAKLERRVRAFFEAPPPERWPGARPEPAPDRLVYLLDHQYTQKGLSFRQLKNADAARVAALREVGRRLDCEIALALADVHETWSCEDEDFGYRRRRYYDGGDDGDASLAGDDRAPELGELQDSSVELRHFIDAHGKVGAATGYVPDSELCYTKPSTDLDPFKSEHEGYMGNWGNTVDRWYHRAAVVLWPRERTFLIRAKMSAKFALDELTRLLKREGSSVAQRNAEQLAPFWGHVWHAADDGRLVGRTLRVALALNSPQLALSLVSPMKLEHLTPRVAGGLVELLERYGAGWGDEALASWDSEERSSFSEKRLPWMVSIHLLIGALASADSAPARKIAERLLPGQWEWLAQRHRSALESHPADALKTLARLSEATLRLVESSIVLGCQQLHAKIQRLLTVPEYPVLAVVHLLEAARRIYGPRELEALELGSLRAHCLAGLEKRLAAPPRATDDWSVTSPSSCSCDLCAKLSPFLAARDRTTMEWPLAKDRRAHIHGILDRYDLPVAHTTRRVGSPHTLVLVKTRGVFERDVAERAACERGLRLLRGNGTAPARPHESRPRSRATAGARRTRTSGGGDPISKDRAE